MNLKFFVPGRPRPAGSKRAFQHKHTGKIMVLDTSGAAGKTWRQDVQWAARQAMGGDIPHRGALRLEMEFIMVRPKSHYGTGKNAATLKPTAPRWPISKPDTTKLVRAVEDALTGIVWRDDAQIVVQTASKVYGDVEGVNVEIIDGL